MSEEKILELKSEFIPFKVPLIFALILLSIMGLFLIVIVVTIVAIGNVSLQNLLNFILKIGINLGMFIIPLFFLFMYLDKIPNIYKVFENKIIFQESISKHLEEVMIENVLDIQINQSFIQRCFHIASIQLFKPGSTYKANYAYILRDLKNFQLAYQTIKNLISQRHNKLFDIKPKFVPIKVIIQAFIVCLLFDLILAKPLTQFLPNNFEFCFYGYSIEALILLLSPFFIIFHVEQIRIKKTKYIIFDNEITFIKDWHLYTSSLDTFFGEEDENKTLAFCDIENISIKQSFFQKIGNIGTISFKNSKFPKGLCFRDIENPQFVYTKIKDLIETKGTRNQ